MKRNREIFQQKRGEIIIFHKKVIFICKLSLNMEKNISLIKKSNRNI